MSTANTEGQHMASNLTLSRTDLLDTIARAYKRLRRYERAVYVDAQDGSFDECADVHFREINRNSDDRLYKLLVVRDLEGLGEDVTEEEFNAMTEDELSALIDSFASDWVDDLYLQACEAVAAYQEASAKNT